MAWIRSNDNMHMIRHNAPRKQPITVVVEMIQRILKPDRRFEFWRNDGEFYRFGARTPRSHCILDVAKLLAAGVEMRPAEEALEDSLHNWRPVPSAMELAYH